MRCLLVVLLAAVAYGQEICFRTNTMDHSVDVVVNRVLKDMDKNNDGIVTDVEILNEFVTRFDHDGSYSISKTEFVTEWVAYYHDNKEFALLLFTKFDMTGDESLGLFDVGPLKSKVDTNHDGLVSSVEFTTYLLQAYSECQTNPSK